LLEKLAKIGQNILFYFVVVGGISLRRIQDDGSYRMSSEVYSVLGIKNDGGYSD